MKSTAPTILTKAESLVSGDRQKLYGPPDKNLTQIAALWSAYLGMEIDGRDVAWLMVMVKAARDTTARIKDNLIDGAGYLRTAEIWTRRGNR